MQAVVLFNGNLFNPCLVRMCMGYVAVLCEKQSGQEDLGLGLHYILIFLPRPKVNN